MTGPHLSSGLHCLQLINPLAYVAFSVYLDKHTMQAEHVTWGPQVPQGCCGLSEGIQQAEQEQCGHHAGHQGS